MTSTDTSWIVPGAAVVVYQSGSERSAAKRTTVAKVAGKSFTLHGVDERIQLDGLTSKRLGGTWDGWRWVVVAPDDPKVAELAAKGAKSRARSSAVAAVEHWNTGAGRDDPAKVQAAIDALTALRDTL